MAAATTNKPSTSPRDQCNPFMHLALSSFGLLLYLFAVALPCQAAKAIDYSVVAEYPHSTSSFIQGLEFYQGQLYESAGGYGRSQLQFRALASNTPTASAPLNPSLFAEGLSILNDKLYQLTWKSGKALVYDPRTLKRVSHFNYQGQGWGLCNDGSQLIMSNGTSQLQFINPENFTVSHRITVRENGKPISWINELEWVNGYIYANVWQSNRILIINPKNGHVEAYVDLSTLLPVSLRNTTTGVLNGIAYHKASQKLYVTGKNWPKLYQIQLNRIMSR